MKNSYWWHELFVILLRLIWKRLFIAFFQNLFAGFCENVGYEKTMKAAIRIAFEVIENVQIDEDFSN